MDGGRVLLEMPSGSTWGNLQTTNDSGVNYITISGLPSRRMLPRTTSIGDDFALVYFETRLAKGIPSDFRSKMLQRKPKLKRPQFKVSSAGSAGEDLEGLIGCSQPGRLRR